MTLYGVCLRSDIDTGDGSFQVQWRIYKDYITAVGYFSFLAIFVAFIASSSLGIGMNLWLSQWSSDSSKPLNETMNVDIRLAVYASLGVGQGKELSEAETHLCPQDSTWVFCSILRLLRRLHLRPSDASGQCEDASASAAEPDEDSDELL